MAETESVNTSGSAAEPIISVSGLRGVVGQSLTPPVVMRYGCAFASTLPPGTIVVTRDGRATGVMVESAICSGLMAIGRDVIRGGVAATPTTGVLVRQYGAAGGIQISASHNPAQYNGMKLFSEAGQVISAAAGRPVMDRYHAGKIAWVEHKQVGRLSQCDDPLAEHLRLVMATVEAERIGQRQFHVLLDANHGAGGALGRRLLEELGCRTSVLGGTADGRYEHDPEPTAENLAGVLSQVTELGADIGFCQDPDADRLAVIDQNGRYLGEEDTLALCADHVLRERPGAVVTNCSTSRMTADLAERYHVPLFRSRVGEANVTELMQAKDAVIGGEGNGGVIDPRVVMVRDSFVGMALILDAMAARDLPVSELADELPRYEIVKTKVSLAAEKVDGGLNALERHFADARPDRLDGLRLDWPDKWLLVRASNTEPVVRIIAEASTADEARRLCRESAEVLGGV